MDNKIYNTIDRIKQFIDFKGFSMREFSSKIGVSHSLIAKTKAIGSDKLENILSIFPELNPIWLLTGEGDMLTKLKDIVNEDQEVYQKEDPLFNEISYLKEVNTLLKEKNQLLEDKIEYLEHLISAAKSRSEEAKSMFPKIKFTLTEEEKKKT